MDKLLLRLCQIYMLLVLLAVTIMSPLPHSLLSFSLLLALLFIAMHPPQAKFSIVITVAVVFLTPLVLAPFLNHLTPLPVTTVQIISAAAILPLIYTLDYYLRQNAQRLTEFAPARTQGRCPTDTFKTLLATTIVIMLASPILNNPVLLLSGIMLALYMLAVLVRILLTIPRLPLDVPVKKKRVIVSTTVDIQLDIISKASIRTHNMIIPVDPWSRGTPQKFTLNGGKTRINLAFTPPLAGASHPQFQLSLLDPWGFIQTNQLLEPVELHVIPRARYAEWLARKYLEQTGAGVVATYALPPEVTMPKRGVEYFDSRTYQPGDQLKDIDWKHSLKSSQPIVKQYIEAGEQAAIIAVNLSVADAEEADKLALDLITTALTLSQDGISTALAAYNQDRVVLTTIFTDPREILKRTLSLIKDITPAEFVHRCLAPPDIAKLRQNITHLKQAESEPAQRLLEMLNFECRALEEAARTHPATVAISTVTEHAPTPAMIIMLSRLNHDAEAIVVTTERLSKRDFTIIPPQAVS